MSPEVINAKSFSDEFAIRLRGNERGKLYGELFVTDRRKAVLRCCVCNVEHRFYKRFLEHIFQHYDELDKLLRPVEEDPLENISVEVDENQLGEINIPATVLTNASLFIEEKATLQVENTTLPTEAHTENEQVRGGIVLDADEARPEEERLTADAKKADLEKHVSPEEENKKSSSSESEDDFLEPLPLPPLPPRMKRKYTRKKSKTQKNDAPKDPALRLKCDICGDTFQKSTYLNIHRRRHLKDPEFPCSMCEKKFHTREEFIVHERRHTGECPYICKYCGAGYPSTSCRNRHEQRHVRRMYNIRPHKCKLCDKAFFEGEQLTKHMVTHTRERKFFCAECNAGFMRRRNLEMHEKIHKNAREYVCNICGVGFNQSAARYLHMRNKHKLLSGITPKNATTTVATEVQK